MFNRAQFNKATFNRHADLEEVGLSAVINSEYGMQIAPLKVLVKLSEAVISSEFGTVTARLGLLAPLPPVNIGMEFSVSAKLAVYVPLPAVEISSEYALIPAALRTVEQEEMNLERLGLAPGQTLIIDTDSLEIEIDNEIRVDCWVTGGVFFKLKNGDNELVFSDNVNSRDLLVTVLWADQYL